MKNVTEALSGSIGYNKILMRAPHVDDMKRPIRELGLDSENIKRLIAASSSMFASKKNESVLSFQGRKTGHGTSKEFRSISDSYSGYGINLRSIMLTNISHIMKGHIKKNDIDEIGCFIEKLLLIFTRGSQLIRGLPYSILHLFIFSPYMDIENRVYQSDPLGSISEKDCKDGATLRRNIKKNNTIRDPAKKRTLNDQFRIDVEAPTDGMKTVRLYAQADQQAVKSAKEEIKLLADEMILHFKIKQQKRKYRNKAAQKKSSSNPSRRSIRSMSNEEFMFSAIAKGDIKSVQMTLAVGAKENQLNQRQESPLQVAISTSATDTSATDIIGLLLRYGADVLVVQDGSKSPLRKALDCKDPQLDAITRHGLTIFLEKHSNSRWFFDRWLSHKDTWKTKELTWSTVFKHAINNPSSRTANTLSQLALIDTHVLFVASKFQSNFKNLLRLTHTQAVIRGYLSRQSIKRASEHSIAEDKQPGRCIIC